MNTYVHPIRVRYEETDKMGIAYYANYFVWFEVARTEYFRSLGIRYSDLETQGYYLPVVEATCSYRKSVSYDDLMQIHTSIIEIGHTWICFSYEIMVEGKKCAQGKTKHVFVNDHMKPIAVPDVVKEKIVI